MPSLCPIFVLAKCCSAHLLGGCKHRAMKGLRSCSLLQGAPWVHPVLPCTAQLSWATHLKEDEEMLSAPGHSRLGATKGFGSPEGFSSPIPAADGVTTPHILLLQRKPQCQTHLWPLTLRPPSTTTTTQDSMWWVQVSKPWRSWH